MDIVEIQELQIQAPLKWKPSQYTAARSQWLVILPEFPRFFTRHFDLSPSIKIFWGMKFYLEDSFFRNNAAERPRNCLDEVRLGVNP